MLRAAMAPAPARAWARTLATAAASEQWRVCKFIARYSPISRRQAEAEVAAGTVYLGNRKVLSPAVKVDPSTAEVRVGKLRVVADPDDSHAGGVPMRLPRLFLAHKLPGEVVTRSDPEGRRTLFERLETMGVTPGLRAVGRLDLPSEGLILLTDDGGFSRYLEHPSSRIKRMYRVRVFGEVTAWKLRSLRKGIEVEGERFRPMDVAVEGGSAPRRKAGRSKRDDAADPQALAPRGNVWLRVTLSEGRNREIRRALDRVGLRVGRLVRVGFGPYRLEGLDKGAVLEVKPPQSVWQRAREWLNPGSGLSRALAKGRAGAVSAGDAASRPAASPAERGRRPAGLAGGHRGVAGGIGRRLTAGRPGAQAGPPSPAPDASDEETLDGAGGGADDGPAADPDRDWQALARSTLDELRAEQAGRSGGSERV